MNKNNKVSPYIKPCPETVWPDPRDPRDIERKLRYGKPTREDMLVAASFIGAYCELCSGTQKLSLERLSKIKNCIKKIAE